DVVGRRPTLVRRSVDVLLCPAKYVVAAATTVAGLVCCALAVVAHQPLLSVLAIGIATSASVVLMALVRRGPGRPAIRHPLQRWPTGTGPLGRRRPTNRHV